MRLLVAILALLVLPGLGWAADCTGTEPCSSDMDAIQRAVDDCCRQITVACLEVKYLPRCAWPEHKCPQPLEPCDDCLDVRAPSHRPLACFTPCDSVCLEPVCHKPAVVAIPVEHCAVCPADC